MIASHRQLVNSLNLEKIPTELRERPQWICWGYDESGKKLPFRVRDGRLPRAPFRPDTWGLASSTNPETWGTFDEAVQHTKRMASLGVELGIGYVFTADDPFCGVDLDGCISSDGTVADWALEILGQMPTYAEISPSGKGVKIFGRGQLPPGMKHKHLWGDHEGIELFDESKYFCVTANAIDGSPTEGRDIQLGLTTAIEKYNLLESPKQKPNPRPAGPRHPIEASEERSDVTEALRYLDPSMHYDDWKNVGMALHDYDPGLLHEWDAWSAGSSKYEPGECERKWASFSGGGGITIDTLFWMAGQAGYVRPIRRDVGFAGPVSGGGFRLDATAYKPLEEFVGEIVFLPDGLRREESGPPESHTGACGCELCERETRTLEARDRETRNDCRYGAFWRDKKTGRKRYGLVDCHSWTCNRHRPRLVERWRNRLNGKMEAAGETFYLAEVPTKNWSKVCRQIRDKIRGSGLPGGRARLSTDETTLIVSTHEFAGSKKVSQEDALRQVNTWLDFLRLCPPRGGNPISTSESWQEEPKPASTWERIDIPQVSDATLQKTLAEFCVDLLPREWQGGRIKWADLVFPDVYYGDDMSLLKAIAGRLKEITDPLSSRNSLPGSTDSEKHDDDDAKEVNPIGHDPPDWWEI